MAPPRLISREERQLFLQDAKPKRGVSQGPGLGQAAQRAKLLDGLRSGGYSLHLITGPHRYLQG
jgi:hypothetical protein